MLFVIWCLLEIITTVSAFDGEIAVYWGQASAEHQRGLRYYCEVPDITIINLAFLNKFPDSRADSDSLYDLNLGNGCIEEYEREVSITRCPSVAEDIKYCQRLGKKVLLSLGGESTSKKDYGFINDEEAKKFASVLWDTFGEGESSDRPFRDSVVDGFDLDIENDDSTGYATLFKELKKLSYEKGTKNYTFTAAPQCMFPDESLSDLIENFELDHLFVQFYNNHCQLDDKTFNLETWANYIKSKGYSTNIFIGLPASKKAAASGFVDPSRIVNVVHQYSLQYSNVHGLMFWDASLGFDRNSIDKDNSYIAKVIDELKSNGLMTSVSHSAAITSTSVTNSFIQSTITSTEASIGSTKTSLPPKETSSPKSGGLMIATNFPMILLLLIAFFL